MSYYMVNFYVTLALEKSDQVIWVFYQLFLSTLLRTESG